MKITEMPQELYDELLQLWLKTDPERPDMERGKEILDYMLFDDGGASVWYIVPPSALFIITNIQPGYGANITPVALYTVDAETAKAELRSVMREYDLRRITANVPAPIHAVLKNLTQIGFALEGKLRDGTVYDLAFTDAVILGLHRSAVEIEEQPLPIAGPAGQDVGKKKRRRRRRSRRKKATKNNASAHEERTQAQGD